MARPKIRSEQHIIDQKGQDLLRSKLPGHWILREYRPDYGLDFAIEVFKTGSSAAEHTTYETLGEHFFVQLKSAVEPQLQSLEIFERGNVEKAAERLNRKRKEADIDVYAQPVDTPELVTVERMGVGVPVLLVIADLSKERCSFVCLNDYIDKILVPRFGDYRRTAKRTIHVPLINEIGTDYGLMGLRWYAKRPKLLAAFQRFTYQFSELQWEREGDWRHIAEVFASKIVLYDFWDDTEMCAPIAYDAAGLRRFIETGQPEFIKIPDPIPDGFEKEAFVAHMKQLDVFELWRLLSLLPKTYEDVWREWFLPTSLGWWTSVPEAAGLSV